MRDRRLFWIVASFVGSLALFAAEPQSYAQRTFSGTPIGTAVPRCNPDVNGNLQCCSSSDPGYPDNCTNIATDQEDDDDGACFGACGRGCSSMDCGGGGFCEAHDSCVSQYGLFAWQCDTIFPEAAVQWAACWTGRIVMDVVTTIVHTVTHVIASIGHAIAKIFN